MRRASRIVPLLLALAWLVWRPVASAAATLYLDETFAGSQVTQPNWVYGGTACLTAGSGAATTGGIPGCPTGTQPGGISGNFPEPSGQGALRLTTNGSNQSGFVLYTQPQSSANGLQAIFTEYSYDGTGADGMSFFFVDASSGVPPTSSGASGGSLGYAQKTVAPISPGIANGYVGIGFDEFGNFSNPTEGRVGGPGQVKETIAIRGSAGASYAYVTGYSAAGVASSLPFKIDSPTQLYRGGVSKRTWRVTLTVSKTISVECDTGSGFVTYIPPTTVANVNGGIFPDSFYFGFSSSTGGSTNIHEINNITIQSATTAFGVVTGPVGNPSAAGSYDGVSAVTDGNDFTERSFTPSGFVATTATTYPSAVTNIAVPNQIYNTGNVVDSYRLVATAPSNPSGWTVQLFPDNGIGSPGTGVGGNGPATTAYAGSLAGATSTATVSLLGAGSTTTYWAVYASPSGLATFARFDAPIVATSLTNSAVTNTTHDELYSGFVKTMKSVAVTSTGCASGATVPAGGVCPGGIITYAIAYTNVALTGGSNATEPSSALLATKAGTLQIVEDGAAGSNTWASTTAGLSAAPSDTTAGSTFLYGTSPGSATFTSGTTRFVDTVGGSAFALGAAASGSVSFSLTVK